MSAHRTSGLLQAHDEHMIFDRAVKPRMNPEARSKHGPPQYWARHLATLRQYPGEWVAVARFPEEVAVSRGPRKGKRVTGSGRASALAGSIRAGAYAGIERGEFDAHWEPRDDGYIVFARTKV